MKFANRGWPELERRTEVLLVALLCVVAVTRVVLCYPLFSQTFDEPVHIAAGLEWLDRGSYTTVIQNPPLARVLEAIGPWLDGARFHPSPSPVVSGNLALYGGDYLRRLSLARMGNLPLLVLAIVATWLWGRRATRSGTGGVIAAALFSTAAPVLGHAAVATADLGCAAGFALFMAASLAWLERPSPIRGALAGGALGLAVLLKFSTLPFAAAALSVVALLSFVQRRSVPAKALLRDGAIGLVLAALVVAAGYRFTVVEAAHLPELVLPDSPFLPGLKLLARAGIPIPGGEVIAGIGKVEAMNRLARYPAFFRGHTGTDGFPLFYPVDFAIKTPMPLLILLIVATSLPFFRKEARDWVALSGLISVAAILLLSTTARVDIGIRMILPVYAAAAVAGAGAAGAMWNLRRAGAVAAGFLLLGQAAVSVAAHPDYLADFNAFAGRHPERIVVDSDLDWGQDLFRLRDTAEKLGIRELSVAYFGTADPRQHGLAPEVRPLRPGVPVTGWIAISETLRVPVWTDGYAWLRRYTPVARAGRSIVIYYVAP